MEVGAGLSTGAAEARAIGPTAVTPVPTLASGGSALIAEFQVVILF